MESRDRQFNPSPAETRPPRKHPIININRSRTETVSASSPGDAPDPFEEIDTSTGKQVPLSSHDRALRYSLLNRRDLPRDLAEGLRQHHRIKRRKSQEKQHKHAIYAPLENPPETE